MIYNILIYIYVFFDNIKYIVKVFIDIAGVIIIYSGNIITNIKF